MAARDTLFAPDIYNVFDQLRAEGDEAKLAAFEAARRKAMTDDQERFEILRGLMTKDNEGTIQLPPDSVHAAPFNGWPTREEQIQIPTTAAVLGILKYSDTKDSNGNVTKTAQEKFIEDYLTKPKAMAKDLAKQNKGFGVKSADILKQAFRESLKDEEERKTQKRRLEVLSGTAEDTPWYDKIAAKLMPYFASNELEAYKRGEDPSIGDYAADLGGNALMLVPGAGYVKGAKIAASKLPVATKVLSSIVSKAPRASRVAQGVFGNSVAPVGTEALKYGGDAIDSDRDAQFNVYNAALGALTNFGVNDILLRKAGQFNKMMMDNQAGRAATKETREALKGAADDKIKAKDILQAFVVNKMGDGSAINYAAGRLGITPATLKAINEDKARVEEARYPKAPLPTDIDETDAKYIKQIIDNPKKIYESNDTDFKMWFATRGNELLRGTEYHVPTWEVKF